TVLHPRGSFAIPSSVPPSTVPRCFLRLDAPPRRCRLPRVPPLPLQYPIAPIVPPRLAAARYSPPSPAGILYPARPTARAPMPFPPVLSNRLPRSSCSPRGIPVFQACWAVSLPSHPTEPRRSRQASYLAIRAGKCRRLGPAITLPHT